jgi:molybdate transport system permease protein
MSTPIRRALPRSVVFGAGLGFLFLAIPLLSLLQRMPWTGLFALLTQGHVADALLLSTIVSLIATVIVILLGLPLAIAIARSASPIMSFVRAIVLVPMVLPPVVGGTALLFGLGRNGLVGQWLDEFFGITLLGTTSAAVIAAVFVAMPFFVITAEGGIRSSDHSLEEVAETLGASRWRILKSITLPAALPSIGAGAALAWARSLGEFGATITFAGNLQGRTQTLPLATYLALQTDPEEALAISLILLTVSVTVLFSLRNRWFPVR